MSQLHFPEQLGSPAPRARPRIRSSVYGFTMAIDAEQLCDGFNREKKREKERLKRIENHNDGYFGRKSPERRHNAYAILNVVQEPFIH